MAHPMCPRTCPGVVGRCEDREGGSRGGERVREWESGRSRGVSTGGVKSGGSEGGTVVGEVGFG